MPTITPIPCPTDDYDHRHSMAASLASLHALSASFDAVMDSLLNSVAAQSRRLDDVTDRCRRVRDQIEQMKGMAGKKEGSGSGGGGGASGSMPVTVISPSSYDAAVAGIPKRSAEKRQGQVAGLPSSYSSSLSSSSSSALALAREASNMAVLKSIQVDREMDDGKAKPSDVWLDRASGFDERKACKVAERMNTVPALEHKFLWEDAELMRTAAAAAAAATAELAPQSSADEVADSKTGIDAIAEVKKGEEGRKPTSSLLIWEDLLNQMDFVDVLPDADSAPAAADDGDMNEAKSVITTSSSVSSSRQRSRTRGTTRRPRGAGGEESSSASSSSSFRQQASSGSQAYLCEVLHDAYGLPGIAARTTTASSQSFLGDASSSYIFPTPASVDELHVFNSKGISSMEETSLAAAKKQTTTSTVSTTQKENEKPTSLQRKGSSTSLGFPDTTTSTTGKKKGVLPELPSVRLASFQSGSSVGEGGGGSGDGSNTSTTGGVGNNNDTDGDDPDAGRFDLPDNLPLKDIAAML